MIAPKEVLALSITKGFGEKALNRAIDIFSQEENKVENISSLSDDMLMRYLKIKSDSVTKIHDSLDKADRYYEELLNNGVEVLIRKDNNYPKLLEKTLSNDAPPILFARGNLDILQRKAVGFCGSRKASEKGLFVTGECSKGLTQREINVVSGYAKGVDLAAHRVALENGGFTTFVLAEGILHFRFKKDVKDLIDDSNHLVLSEFPPRLPWKARNAMKRNKTICGLSNSIVLIESGLEGGTYEAGKTALSLKRPLFVAVYSDFPASAEGNKYFLENGANRLGKKNGDIFLDELFDAIEKDEKKTADNNASQLSLDA